MTPERSAAGVWGFDLARSLAPAQLLPRAGVWARRAPKRTSLLSRMQCAIAACLLDAQTNAEIAESLGIGSEKSVASHIERMRAKLHARNRVDLALKLDRMERNWQREHETARGPAGKRT